MWWQLAALAFLAAKYEKTRTVPVTVSIPSQPGALVPRTDVPPTTPAFLPNPDIGTFQSQGPIITSVHPQEFVFPPPENAPAPWQQTILLRPITPSVAPQIPAGFTQIAPGISVPTSTLGAGQVAGLTSIKDLLS